jgi:hypothetical protein
MRRVTQALNCNHASSDNFHSLSAMAFKCVKCQARIESSRRTWLAVASLDNIPFEYDLNSLPVLLQTLHNRLSMAFEDAHSFFAFHLHEIIANSALLIQRWYRLYWLRRQHNHIYNMIQSSKMKYQARKRRQQCARDVLRLQRQLRRQFQANKAADAKRVKEAFARGLPGTPCLELHDHLSPASMSACSMPSHDEKDDKKTPCPQHHVSTSSFLPVLSTVLDPPLRPPPMNDAKAPIFRCYAPQCGGMRFQNKKWYDLHLQKVRSSKNAHSLVAR